MNLGFAAEKNTSTAALDPMDEFRKGVELLKNEYPQKALLRLRRAYESDKHNAFYSSFLGLAIARAQRKWDQASELCEIAVQLKPKEIQFHLNLHVLPCELSVRWTGVHVWSALQQMEFAVRPCVHETGMLRRACSASEGDNFMTVHVRSKRT